MVVRVGSLRLAFSARQVIEIAASEPIARLPRLPDHVPGLMMLRGRALPVLDLHVFLEVAETTQVFSIEALELDSNRILVVRHDDMTVAIPVDGIEGLKSYHEEAMQPAQAFPTKVRSVCDRQIQDDAGIVARVELGKLLALAKPRGSG